MGRSESHRNLIYVRFRQADCAIGLAADYRSTPATLLFVARYRGEDGDDGQLRYETLQRLTEGIVDWPFIQSTRPLRMQP